MNQPDLKGELFDGGDKPEGLISGNAYRDNRTGGIYIHSFSAGAWQQPDVSVIVQKLTTKTYLVSRRCVRAHRLCTIHTGTAGTKAGPTAPLRTRPGNDRNSEGWPAGANGGLWPVLGRIDPVR